MQAALADHYRKTEYHVISGDHTLVFRIGQFDREMERRLIELAGLFNNWSIITPCNPGSIALCEQENQARLADFLRELPSLGFRWFISRNHDPDAKWPDEEGALILDIPREDAAILGRRLQQNAIVICHKGQAPELLWLVET